MGTRSSSTQNGRVLAVAGGLVAVRADGPAGERAERVSRERAVGMGVAIGPALASVALLEGARRQAELSGAKQRWARVYDSGIEDGLAWVLRERPGVPVGQAVQSGRVLHHEDLRRIVSGVLKGVGAYHDAWGTACGAVDPQRVLIPERGTITSGSVVLTDPTPSSEGPEADIAALGELVWRLVERPGVRTPAYHPVPASKAWKRVGRSGERWRAFANELLDPRARRRGELPTASDLLGRLPKEPVDLGRPARWAAVLVLGAAIGWGAHSYWRTRSISEQQEAELRGPLAALCLNYDALAELRSVAWAGDRWDGAIGDAAQRFGDEVVAVLQVEDDPFRPAQYFPGGRGNSLSQTLYEELVPSDGSASLRLVGAVDQGEATEIENAVAKLDESLAAWATWAPRDEARAWVRAARGRGWDAVADAISEAVDPELRPFGGTGEVMSLAEMGPVGPALGEVFGPESGGNEALQVGPESAPGAGQGSGGLRGGLLPTRSQVEALLWAVVTTDAIGRADEVAEGLRAMDRYGSASGVAGLGVDGFAAAMAGVDGSGEGGALSEARRVAGAWEGSMRALADVLASDRYERVLLGESDAARTILARAAAGESAAVRGAMDELVELAGAYRVLVGTDDPRPLAAMDAQREQILGVIAELDGLGPEAGGDAFRARLGAIDSAREAYAARPVIELFRESLDRDGTTLVRDLESLRDDTEVQLAALQTTIGEQVAELRVGLEAGGWVSAAPVREAWQSLVSYGEVQARSGDEETGRDRLRFRKSAEGLRDVLEWVQGPEAASRLGVRVGPVPDWVDQGVVERAIADELRRGQRVVAQTAARVATEGRVPVLDEAEVASAVRAREDAARAWGERAEALLGDADRALGLLNEGYLPGEPAPAGSASASASDLVAPFLSGTLDAGSPEGALRGAVQSALQRIGAAERALESGRLDDLETIAASPAEGAPELTRAAWVRLGSLSVESGRAMDAASVGQRLLAALEVWSGGGGRSAHAAGVAEGAWSEAPARWQRFARAAGSVDELREVLGVRGAFRVNDGALAGRDQALGWNVAVYELERRLQGQVDGDDEGARGVARGFGAGAPGGAGGGAFEFAQAVREIANNNDPKVEFDKIGPAVLSARAGSRTAGWRYEPGQSDEGRGNEAPRRLVYTSLRRNGPAIEFVLVHDGADGRPPVLLSRHEVSVEVFSQVVRLSDGDAGLRLLKNRNDGLARQDNVPLGWRVTEEGGRSLRVAPMDRRGGGWIENVGTGNAIEALADGAVGEKPGRDSPLQQVEPQIAMFTAQALGCRLPTWDEYSAALRKWHPDAVGDPGGAVDAGRVRANLRDRVWRVQSEYAQQVKAANEVEIAKEFGPWVSGFETGGDLRNGVVSSVSDGHIWFCPVDDELSAMRGPASRADEPMHLIGNVAEWVLLRGGDQFVIDPEQRAPRSRELIGPLTGAVGVAGGSAMMAEVDLSRALPLEDNLATARYGDVGFRLALVLDGRFRSIKAYLLALSEQAYVVGGG